MGYNPLVTPRCLLILLLVASACGPTTASQRPADPVSTRPAPGEIDVGPVGAERTALDAKRQQGLAHLDGTVAGADKERGRQLLAEACRGGDNEACSMIVLRAKDLAPGLYDEAAADCERPDGRACLRAGVFALLRMEPGSQAVEHFAAACKLGSQQGCTLFAKYGADSELVAEVGEPLALLETACSHGVQFACEEMKAAAQAPSPPEVETVPAPDDLEGGPAEGVVGGVLDDTNGLPPPPPPPPDRPFVVPQAALSANFLSGERQIPPPASVKEAMGKAGTRKLVATVKMCLDDAGSITQTQLIKSSGYTAWDDALIAAMQAWRHRPFVVNGKPVPVCTAVTFVYKR